MRKINSIIKRGKVYTVEYQPTLLQFIFGKDHITKRYIENGVYNYIPQIKVFLDEKGNAIGCDNDLTKILTEYGKSKSNKRRYSLWSYGE